MDNHLHPIEIEELLGTQCSTVVGLSPRETRNVWRDWLNRFPLPAKCPGEILRSELVGRMLKVTRCLNGRNAISAFHEQDSSTLVVLTLETLAGWRCQCECNSTLPLASIAADIVVAATDFTWVLGVAGKSECDDLLRYVYLDESCFPDSTKGYGNR